jgi:hypothetical protein
MSYKRIYKYIAFSAMVLIGNGGMNISTSNASVAWGLNASIYQVYDDNITFANENKEDDFRTDLNFGVSTEHEMPNRTYGLRASITQHMYHRLTVFNNTSFDAYAHYHQDLSKYSRVRFKNSFTQAEEPPRFIDEFGNVGERYQYHSNTFEVDYSLNLTKTFNTTLLYRNNIFIPDGINLSESYLHVGGVEARYTITPKTYVSGLYEHHNREYKDSITVKLNRVASGIERVLTNQMRAAFRWGIDFIDSSNSNDKTGRFISASLINTISEVSSFEISYLEKQTASSFSESIFESRQFSLDLKKQFLERLGGSLSGFIGEGELTYYDVKDRYRGFNIGMTYNLSNRMSANAHYRYTKNNSNDFLRRYSRNIMWIGFNLSF